MPTFGSTRNAFQALTIPTIDPNGVTIVDSSTGLGSSPLGIAARESILFGIPNGSFQNLPPDPFTEIDDIVNPLPYWSVLNASTMKVTSELDTTTQTWGLKLDPGTAAAGDYISIKTRSYVTTDDNLALRQKAYLTLSKNGTYAGTTQWNVTLSASYFSATNTSLGSFVIGTALDNGTWTSIGGTTTSGGSAISSSAEYVEFEVRMTATAAVTSSTSATLKSLIVATSAPSTQSFIVVETFTASTTWQRPTGVTTLLGVIAIGGGGGGAGGGAQARHATGSVATYGGGGGGSGSLGYAQNVYIGDLASVTVGIGTAGAGGTAHTFTKAVGGTASYLAGGTGGQGLPPAGGAGGASSFGTIVSAPGGGGGGTSIANGTGGGTAGGAATTASYSFSSSLGTTGGNVSTSSPYTGGAGANSSVTASRVVFLTPPAGTGIVGGAASTSATSGSAITGSGGAGGAVGFIGGGGCGGGGFSNAAGTVTAGNGGAAGNGCGGGGGAAGVVGFASAGTYSATGGNGGSAYANTGAGGGGGGVAHVVSGTALSFTNYNNSSVTLTSGAGGAGATGLVAIAYVA